MYIYDRTPSGLQYRFNGCADELRLGSGNSCHPDRAVSGFLGYGERNRPYLRVDEGLRHLLAELSLQAHLSESGNLGGKAAPAPAKFTVFNLPEAAAKVPNDRTLRRQLDKIGTNEARALRRAFLSFGKPTQFEETLIAALRALPLVPNQLHVDFTKYGIYLARLGAEAFMLGISAPDDNSFEVGFVDHPSRLFNAIFLSHRQQFVHFVIRRLLDASSSAAKPDAHRKVLIQGTALFSTLQSELAREYPLIGLPETLLVAYRRLLVAIIWKHYQMQMDFLFEKVKTAKLRFADALMELDDLFKSASITLLHDEHATVPTFHTEARKYRDYFTHSDSPHIGFAYFSRTARPGTDREPEISFQTVVRRRAQQKNLLEDLQKWSHPRFPPELHDSASWQAWVRDMWDGKWRGLFAKEKLVKSLDVVERYFEAFTAHVPHDLREGCKEQNYLTRAFPRAFTGSLVHDCAVYAIRWVHILGRLFDPKSAPTGIQDPRIFLIEMPGHVGVMIRIRQSTGDHILVGINNKYAKIYDLDPTETDVWAATMVVQDNYREMYTPYIVTPITASPADARSLWKEVCRIYDKKLHLPYSDPSEPHLRYLAYHAGIARIARQLADTVGGLWLEFQQRLAAAGHRNGRVPSDRFQAEIKRYCRSVQEAINAASDKYQQEVNPLIEQINNDLRANLHRLSKGKWRGVSEPTGWTKPWQHAWPNYRVELKKALKSGDMSGINPDRFFPDDDFVAAV